jgi:hypothetical protein
MSEHATQGVIGYGTVLYAGLGDDPETFREIHEMRTAAPPQATADEVEMTHFGSPNRTKEFIQGMIDNGEMTFEVNWRPDFYPDHRRLREDNGTGRKRNYVIVLPGAMETITFPAFVKTLAPSLAPSDAVVMAVTLRCDAQTVEFS